MRLFKYVAIIILLLHAGCKSLDVSESQLRFIQILSEFNNSNSGRILVAAHRAQHTKYPENSLAAIQYSIDSGIDIIEIDVRETRDGKLILMHDSSIDRTTDGSGDVSAYTFSQLQKFELKKTFSDTLTHKIPTLENALKLAKDKIMIDIDIKGASVKSLISIVKKTSTEDQIIFFDSEFPVLDSLKILDPNLIIMPRARSSKDVDKIITSYSPKIIHIDDGFYTNEVVSKIKSSGSRIWINALGKPDSIALSGNIESGYLYLVEGGANVIQTDLPITLNYFLTQSRN